MISKQTGSLLQKLLLAIVDSEYYELAPLNSRARRGSLDTAEIILKKNTLRIHIWTEIIHSLDMNSRVEIIRCESSVPSGGSVRTKNQINIMRECLNDLGKVFDSDSIIHFLTEVLKKVKQQKVSKGPYEIDLKEFYHVLKFKEVYNVEE